MLPETLLFGHKLVVNGDVFHGENLLDSEMSVDLHQDLVWHVVHLGGGDVLFDDVDQIVDTKLFCQGEKVGKIFLGIDTLQAEVVIVNEVDEKAGGADSDTGKIDDDIFNDLNKKGTFRLYINSFIHSFNYCTFVVGP